MPAVWKWRPQSLKTRKREEKSRDIGAALENECITCKGNLAGANKKHAVATSTWRASIQFIPHRKHSAPKLHRTINLSDVYSFTLLEARQGGREGECSIFVWDDSGQTDRQAGRQTGTDFPSGLSCQQQMRWAAVLACCYFGKGFGISQTGWVKYNYPLWISNIKICRKQCLVHTVVLCVMTHCCFIGGTNIWEKILPPCSECKSSREILYYPYRTHSYN
jgi:hypothetical protein